MWSTICLLNKEPIIKDHERTKVLCKYANIPSGWGVKKWEVIRMGANLRLLIWKTSDIPICLCISM